MHRAARATRMHRARLAGRPPTAAAPSTHHEPTPQAAAGAAGSRGPGRAGRARRLPRPGQRVLRAQGQGEGPSRSDHRRRPRRRGRGRGVDHRIGTMGQPPDPRPPVQGALPAQLGAVVDRGHREVPALGPDTRHRPGLRPQAGAGVRRQGARRHRDRARTASRGRRHRPAARPAHHRRVGRAESGSRDHGLPAQPRRGHGAGGAGLQDLRKRRGRGHHDAGFILHLLQDGFGILSPASFRFERSSGSRHAMSPSFRR